MPRDDTYDAVTEVDPFTDPRIDIDEDAAIPWQGERYHRVGRIGKGGMGEVDLCKDARISRLVAMKVLGRKLRDDRSYRSRFLFEARLQGQLEHPSIVPVHDLGETPDGELFFTMKRVKGVTLAEALRDVRAGKGSLTRRRLLTAFSSVCLAIDFAHTRGVVHRDLKPQNIMLGDFGEVYVLDWGIAKLVAQTDTPLGEAVDIPGSDTATVAGSMLGTPTYMAPERKRGITDARTDVFSLGVILGEILDAAGDIPPELASIHRHATHPDAELRFASARELHDAIERYLDGDRDLEMRRKLSLQHVTRAEAAIAQARHGLEARATAARELGRALGLDPSNAQALRNLMRLLSDIPDELPADVRAEIDRRWLARRSQVMRIGAAMTMTLLLIVPFVLWLGVRDAQYLAAFIGLVVAAAGFQLWAAHKPVAWRFVLGFVAQTALCVVLAFSIGMLGIVPASLTVMLVAWRQAVHRTLSGVLMLLTVFAALVAPLALDAIDVVGPTYRFADGALTLLPLMHELPPGPTLVYLVAVTFGILAAAAIYGRLYVNEIRDAEQKLTFQAWQLQQLVPPEPATAAKVSPVVT